MRCLYTGGSSKLINPPVAAVLAAAVAAKPDMPLCIHPGCWRETAAGIAFPVGTFWPQAGP